MVCQKAGKNFKISFCNYFAQLYVVIMYINSITLKTTSLTLSVENTLACTMKEVKR